MTLSLQAFGGGTSDLIFDPSNGSALSPNAPYTIIDAATMLPATEVHDASGATVTQLLSDADGRYAGSAMLQGAQFYIRTVGTSGKTYDWGPLVSTKAIADVVGMGPQLNDIAASAAASAFAAKQAQAAAEAVQTGAATTDASKLTTGTLAAARLPDLSGTYASASALSTVTTTANAASTTAGTAKSTADTAKSTADTAKSTADSALSTANATQAQQTQLMTVTPTVDELVGTAVITTWQSPGQAVTQNETAGGVHSIWIAPFACRIVQATFLWDYWSLAANDTNYLTFQLRRNRALTYTTMVSKTTKVTGGEAVVQRVPWKFAGAAWDSAASTFAEGDVLVMQNSFTGTGLTHSFPLTMTWRYVPL